MSQHSEMYTKFIKELNEEIEDDILSQESTIQIKRLDESLPGGYRPILTWLYDNETILQLLEKTASDSNEELSRKDAEMFIYAASREQCEQITVRDCLTELYKMVNAF